MEIRPGFRDREKERERVVNPLNRSNTSLMTGINCGTLIARRMKAEREKERGKIEERERCIWLGLRVARPAE